MTVDLEILCTWKVHTQGVCSWLINYVKQKRNHIVSTHISLFRLIYACAHTERGFFGIETRWFVTKAMSRYTFRQKKQGTQ